LLVVRDVHQDAVQCVDGIINNIACLFIDLNANDESKLFEAVQAARKILSREKNPPIDEIIKVGIVPKLVDYISDDYA